MKIEKCVWVLKGDGPVQRYSGLRLGLPGRYLLIANLTEGLHPTEVGKEEGVDFEQVEPLDVDGSMGDFMVELCLAASEVIRAQQRFQSQAPTFQQLMAFAMK